MRVDGYLCDLTVGRLVRALHLQRGGSDLDLQSIGQLEGSAMLPWTGPPGEPLSAPPACTRDGRALLPLASGALVALPIDTSDTRGPVGLTMRTDATASPAFSILLQTIRDAAKHKA